MALTMKEEVTIRKAVPADSLRLSVLYKQVYIQTYGLEGVSTEFANFITQQFATDKIENTISNHPGNIIVACYKDNLIGVAELVFNKKCPIDNIVAPELSKLYVLERFCGKGVGHRLLKEAEDIVKSSGINQVWLWVYVLNSRAITFYEEQQYKWIGNAYFQMEFNKYENKVMLKEL
jgi:GNAT superfamily N-acetyltransferase